MWQAQKSLYIFVALNITVLNIFFPIPWVFNVWLVTKMFLMLSSKFKLLYHWRNLTEKLNIDLGTNQTLCSTKIDDLWSSYIDEHYLLTAWLEVNNAEIFFNISRTYRFLYPCTISNMTLEAVFIGQSIHSVSLNISTPPIWVIVMLSINSRKSHIPQKYLDQTKFSKTLDNLGSREIKLRVLAIMLIWIKSRY